MQFKITGSYMDQNRSLVFNLNTAKRTPFQCPSSVGRNTVVCVCVEFWLFHFFNSRNIFPSLIMDRLLLVLLTGHS